MCLAIDSLIMSSSFVFIKKKIASFQQTLGADHTVGEAAGNAMIEKWWPWEILAEDSQKNTLHPTRPLRVYS